VTKDLIQNGNRAFSDVYGTAVDGQSVASQISGCDMTVCGTEVDTEDNSHFGVDGQHNRLASTGRRSVA
jgi:hypothetical protein